MKWNQSNVEKNIALFYGHTILRNLDFARGLFVVFLLDHGVTNFQIGILQSLLFWVSFVFEIPAGLFADKFKRKYSLILSGLLLLISLVLYFAPPNYFLYLLIFALTGMSFAFLSGADQALLYDGLKEAGADWQKKHIHILSKSRVYMTVSFALGTLAGGFLFDVDKHFIFLATAISLSLGLVCLFFIDESWRRRGKTTEKRSLTRELKAFLKTGQGKNLLLFILGIAFLEGLHTPFFIFSQSLFKEYGISGKNIGFLIASGYLVSSLGLHFSPHFAKWGSKGLKKLIFGTTLTTALACALVATRPELPWMVLLFLLINTLPEALFVHTDQYIQDHCESNIRATVCSVQFFTNSIVISLSYAFIGFFSDRIGIHKTLGLLALIPILTLFLLFLFFRSERSERRKRAQLHR